MENKPVKRPQIKICGLTNIQEALGCATLGANAIGCVFYPKSPRNVDKEMAKDISMALYPEVKTVGVFVNATFDKIIETVERCFLGAVQLHGQETPELIAHLRAEKLTVIKGLYVQDTPSLEDASQFEASSFLVEHAKGKLPGGNAQEWNWEKARRFGDEHPFILAGGLSPENVAYALESSQPDAVDVSSGVEFKPGRKDLNKVEAFIRTVSQCNLTREVRRIF